MGASSLSIRTRNMNGTIMRVGMPEVLIQSISIFKPFLISTLPHFLEHWGASIKIVDCLFVGH